MPDDLPAAASRRARTKTPKRSEPIDLDILPSLLGYHIRHAQIALWRDFVSSVGEPAIRSGMFSILVLSEANPGIVQTQLSQELDIDKASMVQLIDRLEALGWVQRRRSSEDRRRQGIHLTAEGRKRLKTLKREIVEHERKLTKQLSRTELAELISLLERIYPHEPRRART